MVLAIGEKYETLSIYNCSILKTCWDWTWIRKLSKMLSVNHMQKIKKPWSSLNYGNLKSDGELHSENFKESNMEEIKNPNNPICDILI